MNSTTGTSTIDLGPLFEQGRWSGFQKFVVAITALAFATDGIANQTLGLALPALVKAWGVPKHALASVAALGLIGIAVGTTSTHWHSPREPRPAENRCPRANVRGRSTTTHPAGPAVSFP